MNVYHVWCNLRPGVRDLEFCSQLDKYLGWLKQEDQIADYRITRRKLGFGPSELGDFHIMIEVKDLAQLDQAFGSVSNRSGKLEGLHAAVNQAACNATFALYRDFPDPNRVAGEEQF